MADGLIVMTNPMPAVEKFTSLKLVIRAGISRPKIFRTSSSPRANPISSASSAAKLIWFSPE